MQRDRRTLPAALAALASWASACGRPTGGKPPADPVPISITVGDQHACAVIAERGVYCWGSNIRGQLGVGATGTVHDEEDSLGAAVPQLVWGSEGAVEVAAGGAHTCARRSDGSVFCLVFRRREPAMVGRPQPRRSGACPC